MKKKFNSIEDWEFEKQQIEEQIKEYRENIVELKYELELLKRLKPRTYFNWNLIKCFFGFHIWKVDDNGYRRICKRCGIVQRREALAPDGFWGPWKYWRN